MLHGILRCRFLRPTYIAIEKFAGFAMHNQKCIIEKAIRWIGYQIQWQKTVDVRNCMGISRARWLALAVRIHATVPVLPFPTWQLPYHEVINHDPYLLTWNPKELEDLKITDAM